MSDLGKINSNSGNGVPVQRLFPFAENNIIDSNSVFAELSPERETAWYIGHVHPHHISKVEELVRNSSAIVTNHLNEADFKRLSWDGGVLGELIKDREAAIAKGVRYVPFAAISELSFNHPTFGVPNVEGARAAFIVAEMLMTASSKSEYATIEAITAKVSFDAFRSMCQQYGQLDTQMTEAIFDDNATTSFFQFLGSLNLKPGSEILAFHNTGRVMPDALKGENPRFLKSNFNPNVDIWGNLQLETPNVNIGPFKVRHIDAETEHFASNQELLDQVIKQVDEIKPALIIINTVTRTGRRLQFVDIASAIKERYSETDYAPLIVLDDAQGLGRLAPQKYLTSSTGKKVSSIWDYADAVFFTGAKMVSSLMGAGGVLFNKDRFIASQVEFSESPLSYRARKYAFVSYDQDRMNSYNEAAFGVVNTPELASLIFAINDLPEHSTVRERLRELRTLIIDSLKSVSGIKIIDNKNAQYEDTIVAFTLINPISEMGFELKTRLSTKRSGIGGDADWDHYPITIPAVITNQIAGQDVNVLRIGLDPRQVAESYGLYKRKVQYLLRAIKESIEDLMNESVVSETETQSLTPTLWPDKLEGIL
ncbi:MAG: hypothetical protein SGJ02_00050 [bacterium]|nr:hypothetical protein [bacterium]